MKNKNLRLYSWNLNGIRAASRKGFLEWLQKTKPNILCIQETKAHFEDLPKDLQKFPGYYSYFSESKKKGYAGTAILTKGKPLKIIKKIGIEKFDNEGRFLLLEFDNFYLLNTYFPHTQRKLTRLNFKMEFNESYLKFIKKFKNKPIILTGDFNVAHKEIDLKNPKINKRNPGFTNEEREFANKLTKSGFIDTFRLLHPKTKKYTWWTYRFSARERNIGWRIDYFFVSKNLKVNIVKAEIHDKTFGSDHCPISIDLNLHK